MPLIVQKFGGSSVADVERIKNVARKVIRAADAGNQVGVVVSAMGKTTDGLLALVAGQITTLGRGGSGTSAVALAAALKADRCDIYTDVDGVYTTDPRIVPGARKLDFITYDEMLELASLGAKVLHNRSVEFAKNYDVPLQVLNSFNANPGTMCVKEFAGMEDIVVSGVAYNRNE